MKRVGCLLLLLLVLTGCSGKNMELERGLALRSRLLSGQGCSFDITVTADYGDELYSFTMNCQGDSKGNLTFCVIEPESIAGITGTVSEEGGKLTFDDAALEFSLMADGQLSPVSAPWIFLRTLRSGYLTSAGVEDSLLRLTIDDSYEDDALQLDIWLDELDIPIRGEVLYADRRILSMDVSNFQIQ